MKSFEVSRSDQEDEPLPGNDRPCFQLSEVRGAGHSQLQHLNIAVSKTGCIGGVRTYERWTPFGAISTF